MSAQTSTPEGRTCPQGAALDVRFGSKATYALQQAMSALLPIATSIAFFGISKVQNPRSIAGGFTEIMCSLRQAPRRQARNASEAARSRAASVSLSPGRE